MRKLTLLYLLIFVLFFACKKVKLGDNPTREEIEKVINNKQNNRAVYSKEDYVNLLKAMNTDKFIVTTINEMRDTINPDKVIVGLRHDIDCHPFKALKMAEIEQQFGFKSTYYLLATAEYYGKFDRGEFHRFTAMDGLYKNIQDMHHEIGIHNDLLTVMIDYEMDPFVFNHDDIEYLESFGINIYGTASHGSTIASQTVRNLEIFSDFATVDHITWEGKTYDIGLHSLKDFGFEYEAYFLDNNKYFSDPGGKWNLEGGYQQVLKELAESKPGDKIQILVHPVWWFK